MNFSKREKSLVYLIFVLCAIYVGYVFVYEPFWMKVKHIKEKIDLAEKTLSAQSALLKDLSVRAGGQADVLKDYYQKESDGRIRSQMLTDLQTMSSKEKVRITDMKPSAIRAEQAYREFPVSMVLEGDLVDIMRFFFDAESQLYQFHVQEFRFSQSFSTKSTLRCQAVLSRIFLAHEQ